MNINISFEYAIYDKDSITNISSEGFVKSPDDFSSVVFKDENNISDYSIRLNFPNRTTFLLSSIVEVVLTSFVLITIIILAYITTILLLIRQRQISQIKSDFINNMSHEFKTPIATINLALSAIKNPQIIGNKRKVNKYLKMIDDENNRMYEQVENVLMISQLEKNELNIEKRSLDLKNVINSSVSHLNLIIKNKNGKISIENEAKKTIINGNESHLTNVFINILDNALKYNDNIPEILIKLYNFEDKLNIEIIDNGIGMSKNVKSKIFQKFFREQTGNLHDIKGHGLGLSYVKKIIDFHDGNISVESELGVGSKFKIELNV
jgi:signal transduction histidine kinase